MDIGIVVQNVAIFAALVAIVWLVGKTRQHRIAKQTEIQQQLLAKFESAGELTEFLESESGRQFMRQFESNPHRSILALMSVGIILTFLGLGFHGLAFSNSDFVIPGVITLVLGAGFIVAAMVSRRLSKQWQQELRNGD